MMATMQIDNWLCYLKFFDMPELNKIYIFFNVSIYQ